jgi:DNA-binding transcriptional ArsR family regulator
MIGVRAEGSGAEARARTEILARRLKTISDPTRLAMVEVLRTAPSTVSELAELFALAQPTVSNHVKVLRDAGIVANRSQGGRRQLVLQPEVLEELIDHLEGMLSPARRRDPAHGAASAGAG